MPVNKKWILIAGLFGFTGVAIGAFGSHVISDKITADLYETYKTGVFYHLIHTVIIAVIGFYANKIFTISAVLFSIGIILFSFSLYLYSLTGYTLFALITPFGGISFLAGWVFVIRGALSNK